MADIQYDNSGGWGSGGDVLNQWQLPKGEATTNQAGPRSDSGGALYTTPGYTAPPPPPAMGANGIPNVPRPSVDPTVVYTDAQGNGYDPGALSNAMKNNPGFASDPRNARVGDILSQYGYGQTPPAATKGPSGYSGTSVFSDPATSQYEQLLNGLISRLNTNYTPPSFGSSMDALKSYITQLNGPAYTPDQMNLFNTQAIDPIMAQRDADEQAIIQRFAAQGMSPSSGPVQAAIMANRQKYGAQADQARAQIASQGVNTQKQQQAAAMGYQLQIPTLETNLNSYNLGNAEQAAQYAGVIPNLAWSRLSGAQNTVGSGINPLAALQTMNQFQQQGYNQGADYSQNLMQVLPYLLQMFGVH